MYYFWAKMLKKVPEQSAGSPKHKLQNVVMKKLRVKTKKIISTFLFLMCLLELDVAICSVSELTLDLKLSRENML